jgi:hypothetical protein
MLHNLGYGTRLRALSGKFGSSGVLRALAPELLTSRLPIFDSMDYSVSPEGVAALFE